MNSNSRLVERLYTGVNRHDAQAVADCYHEAATFRDIAFDLHGKPEIASMWDMICSTDIHSSFEVLQAGADTAVVNLTDDYTFSETGRRVRNRIVSRLRFRDGLIVEQVDSCDPRAWAAMAFGGFRGFLAGHVAWLRKLGARRTLRKYLASQAAGVKLPRS